MRIKQYKFPFIDVRAELKKKSGSQFNVYTLYLRRLQEKNWKYAYVQAYQGVK